MEVKENPKLLYSFGFFVYICIVLIKICFMDFKYKIIDGEATITGVKDKSVKSLDVPEFIDNLPVTNIGNNAFYDCTSLKEINIPNSVTNIGYNAFYKCTSLKEINIPNSVTNIGEYAFYDCTSLKEINIPNSVTNIGDCAFSNCTSLKEINIPNSVTNIGDCAFWGCYSLNQINGVDIKEGVNFINNRFIYCNQLIYKILYQICDDYICENNGIFINGKYFKLWVHF